MSKYLTAYLPITWVVGAQPPPSSKLPSSLPPSTWTSTFYLDFDLTTTHASTERSLHPPPPQRVDTRTQTNLASFFTNPRSGLDFPVLTCLL